MQLSLCMYALNPILLIACLAVFLFAARLQPHKPEEARFELFSCLFFCCIDKVSSSPFCFFFSRRFFSSLSLPQILPVSFTFLAVGLLLRSPIRVVVVSLVNEHLPHSFAKSWEAYFFISYFTRAQKFFAVVSFFPVLLAADLSLLLLRMRFLSSLLSRVLLIYLLFIYLLFSNLRTAFPFSPLTSLSQSWHHHLFLPEVSYPSPVREGRRQTEESCRRGSALSEKEEQRIGTNVRSSIPTFQNMLSAKEKWGESVTETKETSGLRTKE